MYLKNINIVGFKTFPDKVNIELIKGINAFVGPNGCGKSNLIDAIRWGLGEQNPYALRGTRMEDIIFAGTESRKPLGMAEVTLTLDNQDSLSSTFSEIAITRRLFRSGESEYLINRTPVRLKDVQEILLDTGLGAPGYSFLSQEMVEFVILSKPRERRALFEEVAGVSHFKSEKQKILKNIEKARENLIRLQDLTGEMERQLKYIKRQAIKARKYKELSEKVKNLEINLAFKEYQKLSREKKKLERIISQIKEREIFLEREVQEEETRKKELNRMMEKIEDELEKARQKERVNRENLIKIEGKLNLFEERRYRIERFKENSLQRAKNLTEELESTINSINTLKEKEKESRIALEESEKRIQLLNEKIREFSKEREKWERIREELREKNFEVVASISRLINEIDRFTKDIHNVEVKIFRIGKELKNFAKEKELLNNTLENLRKDYAEKKSFAKELQKEISNIEAILQEKTRETDKLRKNLKEKITLRETLEAKVSLWEEILKGDSQIPSGNRYLKEKYPRLSLFGDLVEPDSDTLKAFESLFIHIVDALWVDNWEEAKRLLEEAKKEKKGRVKLIVGKREEKEYWGGRIKGPEAVSQFLPQEKQIKLVKDLKEAEEVIKRNISKIVVTSDGEVFYPNGLITAVYDEKSIVTGREKRFREMIGRVKKLSEEVKDLEEKVEENENSLNKLKNNLENKLKEKEVIKRKIEEGDRKKEEILKRQEEIEKTLLVLNSEREEGTKEKENLEKALREIERDKEKEENRKVSIGDELRRSREAINSIEIEVNKVRENLQDEMKKSSHWKASMENIKNNLRDLEEKKEKLEKEKVQGKVEVDKYTDEMETIVKTIKELEEKREKEEREAQEIKVEIKRLLQMKEEKEKERRNEEEKSERVRKEWEESIHQLQEKELSFTRIEGEMRNISSRIYSLYQVEIDRWEGEFAVQEEDLEYLKDKLRRIGEVNLTAIEEENEIESRYQFYLNQKEDIEKSIEELRNTLKYLEKEARRKFLEVFEEIRREFSRTFKEIFEGGEADLRLTEEENFEEKGVEIMASPPGKRLSHLSLLSQGERALVAISLLFSFFRIKPSPFCMLDEIDAPLDDPNVNKLLKFLGTLKNHTQFLIISHNKRTLSEADALFGITMEEPGISKVLSVNFLEATKISEG